MKFYFLSDNIALYKIIGFSFMFITLIFYILKFYRISFVLLVLTFWSFFFFRSFWLKLPYGKPFFKFLNNIFVKDFQTSNQLSLQKEFIDNFEYTNFLYKQDIYTFEFFFIYCKTKFTDIYYSITFSLIDLKMKFLDKYHALIDFLLTNEYAANGAFILFCICVYYFVVFSNVRF